MSVGAATPRAEEDNQHVNMPSVTVSEWISAVTSEAGPAPELRHCCHVLARRMGGEARCFPSVRTIGSELGVHHTTAARWLRQLVGLGWVEIERRMRQFGRVGHEYRPRVPNGAASAPISEPNGAVECSNPVNGAQPTQHNGASEAKIGARGGEIGAPERSGLLLTLTEKSAASPSPAIAGSAAPKPPDLDLHAQVTALRALGWSDARILAKWRSRGMTEAHLREAEHDPR